MRMAFLSRGFKNLQWYSMTKRNTTHSGGVSFWSIFDLRCKSPACGDFYRKAEGTRKGFPRKHPLPREERRILHSSDEKNLLPTPMREAHFNQR